MATDVSTSLPDLVLAPGATLTVTMDEPLARVTLLNVYGFSPAGQDPSEFAVLSPLLTYGANV